MALSEDKLKAIESAIAKIEKDFGKGSIMKLGEVTAKLQVEVIPTGSLGLDIALGIGGIPRGRITEIFGHEASGKTTLALHIIAEAQKRGGIAAFIDAEHALDPIYARNLGVNIDELWISQPDNGEQALGIADVLSSSGAVDVVVIDSVAALVPKAEIDGDIGDQFIGLQARLMSQALRRLTGTLSKSKTACVFINQLRERMQAGYGPPEITPGGRALKFYASIRLDIRKTESVKDGDDSLGNRVRVKVVKNKLAPPFRQAEFDIVYGKGISRLGEVIDLGVDLGIVTKAGSWYSYNTERLGQGKQRAIEYLSQHPDMAAEIERQILEKSGVL
ncbi:MAG: recombinase RecA [bacterium]|nr:recombinase RecA [bacterium]